MGTSDCSCITWRMFERDVPQSLCMPLPPQTGNPPPRYHTLVPCLESNLAHLVERSQLGLAQIPSSQMTPGRDLHMQSGQLRRTCRGSIAKIKVRQLPQMFPPQSNF